VTELNNEEERKVEAKSSTDDFPIASISSITNEVEINDKVENEVLLKGGSASTTRLVIATWKMRQNTLLIRALKPGVEFYQYKADATFSSILSAVANILKGKRVTSLAYLCHGNPGTLVFCNNKIVSASTVESDSEVKMFLHDLLTQVLVEDSPNIHLDFLASPLLLSQDGQQVLQALKNFLNVPITVSKDILGTDGKRTENKIPSVGELYFHADLLRSWSGSGNQSISSYEKIRTIGRGAYGTAVLYRKKDDDSLVVLKEISMLDLSAAERQSSMNEVKVLSMLSHPNIVSYFDSFDEDGTLWIEMEYADGGTLTDYLAKQDNDLEEREILIMFSQMVSAIKYCHDHNILHRDLKTQNIFLTQEYKVKLGDFGIAKIMTTHNAGNFTVIGTPYYISPEMCEGKPYDHKSDIWALGCILYEMANLVKTFDGTNLPALITKIVKGTFAPIKETYSPEFRLLIRDLLQKDPADRPLAQEILFNRLPELLQRYDHHDTESGESNYQRTRSILYYCDVSTMQLYEIEDLPVKIQITEVAIGLGHIVLVSVERGVYTWGDNSFGQLGHGDYEPRSEATEVELLRGKSITRVVCGDFYTAFLSDNGIILTCGQGDFGCLGHADWKTLTRPKLLDALLTVDVATLNGGSHHLAVTTAEGAVFTWGCGFDGRLGHSNEEHLNVPTQLNFADDNIFINDVRCSNDGTVFIADTGTVFACGRNTGNKLGLNPRQGFLLQFRSRANKIVEFTTVPTLIKDLCRYQISDMQFGGSHSALINCNGHVYTNGNNSDAQLGCGNTKPREVISVVKGFEVDPVTIICCGSTYTMAGVLEQVGKNTLNSVYFWGTNPKFKKLRNISTNESFNASKSTSRINKLSSYDEDTISNDSSDPSNSLNSSASGNELRRSGNETRRYGGETARSEVKTSRSLLPDEISKLSDEEELVKSNLRNIFKGANLQTLNLASKDSAPVIIPYVVFKFQSIGSVEGYDDDEEFPVVLQDIKCAHDHVIIHLETTAPPPKKRKLQEKSLSSSLSSVTSNFKEESSEYSEMDTSGEVPTWIRKELEEGISIGTDTQPPIYIDSGQGSDDEMSQQKTSPLTRTKSCDTLTRRTTQSMLSKDPNFNLVPKLQKQGTLLRILEVETLQDDCLSETRIIDGVSFTTSTAKIRTSDGSGITLNEVDENNNNSDVESIQLPGSLSPQLEHKSPSKSNAPNVEYTPVEKINFNSTLKTKKATVTSPKSSKPPTSSKSRLKRTLLKDKTENAYRSPRNTKKDIREKLTKEKKAMDRPSSSSDIDDMNDERSKSKVDIEEIRRQAKISEENLKDEIDKLYKEKQQQEEVLKQLHDLQLKEKEEKSNKEILEANAREDALKNEILNLKTDLNNQNSKLQDNYNILLSLQEQLLHMQQSQMRSNGAPKQLTTQQLKEAIATHGDSKHMKSSVCSIM